MIDPRPLKGVPCAVIDFEATGTNPRTCHPVAVAVVFIDALGITEPRLAYSTLINPGVPIPPDSTAVHGITDDDVKDAPNPETVFEELIDTVADRVVVAYNLGYDWYVWWCIRKCLPPPAMRGICVFVMAKEIDKYEKGKKLFQVVSERRGIELDAHKAESDAFATALALPIMLGQLGRGVEREKPWGKVEREGPWCRPEDLRSVEAFWRWTKRTGAAQERDLQAYFEKKGKGPLDSTPWQDLEAAPPPGAFRPGKKEETPESKRKALPPDWDVWWQAQETP